MAESTLPDPAKVFAVQSLACYDHPSVVVKALKDEFGITITRQSVEHYDHTKANGTKDKRWVELFESTRKAFKDGSHDVGLSHRVVRLRALSRLYARAETMGNIKLAMELLEQIAKECGEVYTNRSKVEAAHSGVIEVVSKEQRDAAVAAAIRADS